MVVGIIKYVFNKNRILTKIVSIIIVLFFLHILNVKYSINNRFFMDNYLITDNQNGGEHNLHLIRKGLQLMCPNNVANNLNWIFAITPSKPRLNQVPGLISIAQTLEHVKNLYWMIIIDGNIKDSEDIYSILKDKCINGIIISTPTDSITKHRGVYQRNFALNWLKQEPNIITPSDVIYFMDDDNVYHTDLFIEIRSTEKLKFFAVAYSGASKFEGPICDPKTSVYSLVFTWKSSRKFASDMAGFCFSFGYYLHRENVIHKPILLNNNVVPGFLEEYFLRELSEIHDPLKMELVDRIRCSKILVWHTKFKNVYTAKNAVTSQIYNDIIV